MSALLPRKGAETRWPGWLITGGITRMGTWSTLRSDTAKRPIETPSARLGRNWRSDSGDTESGTGGRLDTPSTTRDHPGRSPEGEPLSRSVPLLRSPNWPAGAIDVETPLFICYANCCRSVLAYYLYRHLHADDPALSAGLFAGECINHPALAMLRHWGIDASGHCPRQVDRELCDQASPSS